MIEAKCEVNIAAP